MKPGSSSGFSRGSENESLFLFIYLIVFIDFGVCLP
ncbi:hypothetical protein QBD00_000588 [Ochrobactrum sp. AN78]|nr:hypothetical protein [Ochrobactrum sp. AN78]